MDYICIFFGILFTAGGIIFSLGKGHIHLQAWKNMAREEKEKIRITELCRNIGAVIVLNGLIFLTKGFWLGFSTRLFSFAMIAWLIIAGIDVWYISKSDRYRNR